MIVDNHTQITFPCWSVNVHDSDISETLEKELDKSWCQENLKSWIYFAGGTIYCGMRKDSKLIGDIVDRYVLKKRLDYEESVETLDFGTNKDNPYFNVF